MKNIFDKRINIYAIFLFLILALNVDFLYLFPSDLKIVVLSVRDINFLLILAFFAYIFVSFRVNIFDKRYRLWMIIQIAVIVLAITSSIQANLYYSQPITLGLRAQREDIVFPLVFLSYLVLFYNKKISKNAIINVILMFSFLEMLLGLIQVFLGSDYKFLSAVMTERYGRTRLFMDISFPILSSFICLNSLIKGKHIKKSIFVIVLTFAFLILVVQWRMPLVAFIISMIICSVFISEIAFIKKIFVSIFIIVGVLLFVNTDIGSNIFNIILGQEEVDTSLIRDNGRDLYLGVLGKYPLFGGGYPNITWPEAAINSGYESKIYAVDNGIFGYAFYYGFVGVFYIVFLNLYILIKSIRVFKYKKDVYIIGYVLYSAFALYTVFMLGMGAYLILPVILLLFSININECSHSK